MYIHLWEIHSGHVLASHTVALGNQVEAQVVGRPTFLDLPQESDSKSRQARLSDLRSDNELKFR